MSLQSTGSLTPRHLLTSGVIESVTAALGTYEDAEMIESFFGAQPLANVARTIAGCVDRVRGAAARRDRTRTELTRFCLALEGLNADVSIAEV